MNNFYLAMYQADLLYGVKYNSEDDFAEIALIGFGLIGNKRTKLYNYTAEVINGQVTLPCNCDQLEAVTYNFEDYNYTTNYNNTGDTTSSITEEYIEKTKHFTDPLYTSGKFVKYERVGDTLYISNPEGYSVNILYHGIVLDDDDLPELTDKEVNALATYVAWVSKLKEAFITNNLALMQTAMFLQKQWNVQCDQARADHYFTLNDMDEILNVKTSWLGKTFNKSFKPIH